MAEEVTSNLLTQMEAWIASADGQRYACTRQYPHPDYACDHDAKCVGCLMVSAALELRKGYETTGKVLHDEECANCGEPWSKHLTNKLICPDAAIPTAHRFAQNGSLPQQVKP